MTRAEQLAANLAVVRRRIAEAARAAGRDAGEITLVAVSKTYPPQDVAALAGSGQHDFAENRHQEAAPKAALLPQLRWHFVGRLQTNKARQVAGYASLVHSVDRIGLLAPLARGAEQRPAPLPVLIQVSLDAERGQGRGGARPADVAALAAAVAGYPQLQLAGVMAVAPQGQDPRGCFAGLRRIHQLLLADHPQAVVRSAGMSADLEAAIAEGATLVRVGSALFGVRPPTSR